MAGGERSKATLVAAAAEKQVEKKEAMVAAEKKESLVYSLFGLGLWCVSGLDGPLNRSPTYAFFPVSFQSCIC
jgi:hypothetical protein